MKTRLFALIGLFFLPLTLWPQTAVVIPNIAAQQGQPFLQCLSLLNAAPPITWTLMSGAGTQDGITFNVGNGANSGCFTGTPTGPGTYNWGVKGSDAAGNTSGNQVVMIIASGTVSVDTSLVVQPATSSGVVNGANASFSAVGNATGNPYTSTWTSANPAVAQSQGNGVFKCLAAGSAQVTASFTGLANGKGTANCTSPVVGSGLLSGCNYVGTGGCALPAGWTMLMQNDFECSGSHASPPNTSCSGSNLPNQEWYTVNGLGPTAYQTDQAHSGTHSWGGNFQGDGAVVNIGWNATGGATGSYHSLYGSYWVWDAPNATAANSDFFLFGVINPKGGTASACWIAEDAQWYGNPATASMRSTSEFIGAAPDAAGICGGNFLTNQGFSYTMPQGAWHQLEFQVTPSTQVGPGNPAYPPPNCNSLSPTSPGCGNGAVAVWLDGKQVQNILNADLNGTVSWNDAAMYFGGLITSFSSGGDTGTNPRCSIFGSNGTPTTPSTNASPGQCNGTQPGTGAPQPFAQRIDDVILLKQ